MKFQDGDIVSGRGIRVGRLVGEKILDGSTYLKVYDLSNSAIYYVPLDRTDDLRKLPSKKEVEKFLKIFDDLELIDEGVIDDSRYKYFKSKLDLVNFQKTLEVLHDLSVLKHKKEINSSERKLFNDLKEKMIDEMAYILECETEKLEGVIELTKFSS